MNDGQSNNIKVISNCTKAGMWVLWLIGMTSWGRWITSWGKLVAWRAEGDQSRAPYANRRGFLSLLLQYRNKKPSFMKTKQLTGRRNQQAEFLTPLFYSRESQTESQSLGEWNLSDHEQALIDGSRSPLLETHGKNFPKHSPSRIARNAVRAYEALAFPYPAESSAVGNRQRHSGGTHKEHHNLQADALLRRLDKSQTRCSKSPQLGRRTTT